ncbi:MAG: D-glycero-beta-D-manno-heptose 1-phosphate adenylyltransferase [Candidatus Marinimicrobia bacterium]|nr:D-glycero-beta-D-manno-heptose 1-phosphate adenylyltransferase [Candidatus Neomarinimicrobiota bacterium]
MLTRTEAAELVSTWQSAGDKVIFTNGCFDLLHRGHIEYLLSAAALGDKLIIGLNSDDSVKKLKGNGRPLQSAVDRTAILQALTVVDTVVVFDEETPAELIAELQPDVLVKGGDYQEEDIVGRESVLAKGGEIKIIPYVEGASTSNIISSILASKSLD